MPSRRSGTRSHHGCQNCKARHVKCDETFPTCNRCRKRNEVCTLSLRPAIHARARTLQQGNGTRSETPSGRESLASQDFFATSPSTDADVEADSGRSENIWLDDMLMDHYIKVASLTLSENVKITALYHDIVPELAERHPHLKHSLLSISGAHCVATLSKGSEPDISRQTVNALIGRAMAHQGLALKSFVKAITAANETTLSEEESKAVTLTSVLLFTSYIAHQQEAFQQFSSDNINAISKAIALLNIQGPIVMFFQKYKDVIANSELKAYHNLYPTDELEQFSPDPEEAASLAKLSELCSADHLSAEEQVKFGEAVKGLVQSSKIIAADPMTLSGRYWWVIGATAVYMANKIYKRVPEALILLAHWAVHSMSSPSAWWGSDFERGVIEEVSNAVPESYAAYMEWPLRELRRVQGATG